MNVSIQIFFITLEKGSNTNKLEVHWKEKEDKKREFEKNRHKKYAIENLI